MHTSLQKPDRRQTVSAKKTHDETKSMTTTYPYQIKKDGVPQSVHLMLRALVKIEILDDGVRRLESMLLVFHQQSRGGMGSLIMGP